MFSCLPHTVCLKASLSLSFPNWTCHPCLPLSQGCCENQPDHEVVWSRERGIAPLEAAFLPHAVALAWPRWISLHLHSPLGGVSPSQDVQAPDCSERVASPGLYRHFPATI